MGTLFRLQLFAPDEDCATRAAGRAFEEAHRLDRMLSDYHPESELMKLCRKPAGVAHDVPDELFEVLAESVRLHRLSAGAFDVTIGHLTKEWRRAARRGKLPDERRLGLALSVQGGAAIGLRERERKVVLSKPGMLLDLGGIAKGYAADRMLDVLVAEGCPMAIVSAGGDLRVGAAPPGSDGWEVVLRPFGAGEEGGKALRVAVEHCAVSTSGSVHQFVEIEGHRYSHMVDPVTGLGIDPGLACTVLADRARESDPLATAFCILGVDKGLALAEKLEVELLFAITRDAEGRAGERVVYLEGSEGFPLLLQGDDGACRVTREVPALGGQ